MAYFLLGFLVLIAVLLLSRWVAAADPARLVKTVRWALIVLVVAGLAAVAWAGRYLLAAYVLPFLIPVLIRGGLNGLGRRSSGGRSSSKRSTGGRGGSSNMSRDDAYAVLGLAPGASETAIREAHRRLMAKVHPDKGGSDYLAAQINRARDVLLG
jgi:hypothetical protein